MAKGFELGLEARPMLVAAAHVNLDDLLDMRPGGIVRMREPPRIEPWPALQRCEHCGALSESAVQDHVLQCLACGAPR